ncbi:MAG: dihydrofolate reductase family protein [Paludibacteraceae bacterium]|nr:dihydrofolate reductase family protein [Paludibacteraceae bacterium]
MTTDRKVILYIATSLDGFIARPDGNLDWLTSVPNPQTGDYGYADLLNSIGTTIMGRKTYNEIIGFGVDWPYPELNSFVVTTNKDLKIQSPGTYTLTENLKDFVTDLKKKTEKDIWLIGGGQLITTFINEGLLDKMIITIIPKIIGEGLPLFADKPKETNWKLLEAKSFDTGVVNLTYEKAD